MEGKGIVGMREKKLYHASLEGSVESLHALMQEDKLTLARVSVTCFNETPLHVAAMLGHLDFARALLYYKPDLFVTRLDSEGRSPLHLASANGYIEIVRLLLTADPEVCLIRDEERRTPLHLAIMNGQIDVVKELVIVKPEATMYTLDQGETILHSCVIYNRLEALKFLIESRTVQDNYADITDDIGNTILHTATALKRVQIVKYLLNINEVKVINAVNGNGFTALNTIENMPKDVKTMEIKELLISTGARRANDLTELTSATTGQVTRAVVDNNNQISPPANVIAPRHQVQKKEKKNNTKALLIAASVIAAMAYQSTLSPPGGLDEAGKTILAKNNPDQNNRFWLYNTISFIASLCIIFLFASGLPLKRRTLIWLLRAAMWVTVWSMAAAYLVSLIAITPVEKSTMDIIIVVAILTWYGLIGISVLVLICHLILCAVRKCRRKRALNNADEDVQAQINIVSA